MATTERDYYEVLGVARDADDAAIKKAFRGLARTLHPDVSDAPDAEERFREVVEAYEVLSKPEARELYDRYGHAGLRGGGYQPTQFDLGDLTDIFSAFFGDDLFAAGPSRAGSAAAPTSRRRSRSSSSRPRTGRRGSVPFPVALPCDVCAGSGVEPGKQARDVRDVRRERAGRAGLAQRIRRVPARPRVPELLRVRDSSITHPCRACEGSGRRVEQRALEVEIPPGIHDGQRIRLTGEGHAGVPGGRSGDLYVQVRVRSRPPLRAGGGRPLLDRRPDDDPGGARREGAGADARAATTELEFAGRAPSPARSACCAAAGCPCCRASAAATTGSSSTSAVPRKLTDEQRRLLEEFERAVGEDTYRADEGFFEKLKSAFR